MRDKQNTGDTGGVDERHTEYRRDTGEMDERQTEYRRHRWGG